MTKARQMLLEAEQRLKDFYALKYVSDCCKYVRFDVYYSYF